MENKSGTLFKTLVLRSSISRLVLVSKQLYTYVSLNNLLYDLQFGFQPGKSTVHPLLHIVDYISKAFNDDEITVAVFLDLQKAFDLVDHNILVMKLEKIGVNGIVLKWFKSYLSDRKQMDFRTLNALNFFVIHAQLFKTKP